MYSISVSRLLAYVLVLLVCLPPLVFAQSTVNLTLDRADMDEATLSTGGFTVTRDGSTNEGINVFVEVSGSAAINADYTVQNLLQSAHPIWYVHIPGG